MQSNYITSYNFYYINSYLKDITSLTLEYQKAKKDVSDIGFNIFKISSDLYYRENFHSDIIKSFLDPNEEHHQNTMYLFQFIDLLNLINPKIKINKDDFKNSDLYREKDNIDILVLDESSKKAIIIENKINNAVDQKKQLPKYYLSIKNHYSIEAIVYITLNSFKIPNENRWTDEESLEINKLLKIVPAYDRNKINLYNNWIIPSIINTDNADCLLILRQYGSLIKYLNKKSMDTICLEKFYNTLKQPENLLTTIAVRNMLNQLPEYLAIRIEDKYKKRCSPFKIVWRYQKRDVVFEAFEYQNLYFKLDIWCNEEGYKLYFYNPKLEEYNIKKNLPVLSLLNDFQLFQNKVSNLTKHYNFNQEEELFSFIDYFLEELTNLRLSTDNRN